MKSMACTRLVGYYAGLFLLLRNSEFCVAVPFLHPDIWNHDGMQGGSLLGLHDYNGEHQQARKPGEGFHGGVTNPPRTQGTEEKRTIVELIGAVGTEESKGDELKTGVTEKQASSSDLSSADADLYLIHAADLNFGPAYENTVNPFLSHLEQGWKLKPVRHRYMRNKILANAHLSPQQQQKMGAGSSVADDLFGPLPDDPDRAHFMDSGEAADADENRAFGKEEKDLGDMLHVLFSPDY